MKSWNELTNIQRAFVGIAFIFAAALLPEIAFLVNLGGIELAFALILATFTPFLTWLGAKYRGFTDVVTIIYIAYRQSASAKPRVFAVQAFFLFCCNIVYWFCCIRFKLFHARVIIKRSFNINIHNKNTMVGILLAKKALLKSPYVKCYVPYRGGA